MSINLFSALVARRVGAAMLGGAALWTVAREAGPRDCEVVIHVVEADLEVRVDGRVYPREADPFSPIVCDLRSGHHTMSVRRGGRSVHEEEFELGPGDHIVLTALDDAWFKARPAAIRAARPGAAPATPPSRGFRDR
jgi:hypothetical protein